MKAANPDTAYTVRNWTAKRSGKNITVTGECARLGGPLKLTDIAEITVVPGEGIAAQHASGTPIHTLLQG